jgi:hypothetical protein
MKAKRKVRSVQCNRLLQYKITDKVILNALPLWSSVQSFWLQIQRSRVRFPALPDLLRGLERGPLNLVGTIEELLE